MSDNLKTSNPKRGQKNGHANGPTAIVVWDPLVRLIHWSLALAILVNGAITDPESELHEWIGYFALALVALRLVWGVFGSQHARFSAFPPNPLAALRHITALRHRDMEIHLSHNPLGALMVYNIWATVLLLSATGIMMGTSQFFGVEWVEEFHEVAFTWLLISVVLHVGGVVFDTWLTRVPLVRAMITGRKILPRNAKLK
jgi:cytochrome b